MSSPSELKSSTAAPMTDVAIVPASPKHVGLVSPSFFSLNIACSARDEKHGPLWQRMPGLLQFLQMQKLKHGYNVLCIQEVRGTGPLTAMEVVRRIAQAVNMEYVWQKVNPSSKSFIRVTYYDPDLWVHLETRVEYVTEPSPPENQKPYPFMWMHSKFARVDQEGVEPEFTVCNTHAPVGPLGFKKTYWQSAMDGLNTSLDNAEDGLHVLMGDMNKFKEPEEQLAYNRQVSEEGLEDLIYPQTATFRSFDFDKDPKTGETFISSLDSCCVNETNKQDYESQYGGTYTVYVESTTPEMLCGIRTHPSTSEVEYIRRRVTDHFGVAFHLDQPCTLVGIMPTLTIPSIVGTTK